MNDESHYVIFGNTAWQIPSLPDMTASLGLMASQICLELEASSAISAPSIVPGSRVSSMSRSGGWNVAATFDFDRSEKRWSSAHPQNRKQNRLLMQESVYGLPSAELISFWTFHGGTAIQDQWQKWKCVRVSCMWALRGEPLLLLEAVLKNCKWSDRGPRGNIGFYDYGDKENSLFALHMDGCELRANKNV
ncbi:hypothetical protein FCULG_00000698 [Fusarium culmorum]|uniref:Uncharacterized protein n=1 Tax=Fusarium culmorum TaxID=5516 RepID=A0A2T4GKD7_FUSCU|nr:hypothetical protein FCULG_00000698 [Fusarium culmorum]